MKNKTGLINAAPISVLIFFFMFFFHSLSFGSKFNLNIGGLKNNSPAPEYCISLKSGGKNISPEAKWQHPPKGTKSFILTCIDTNPAANNWVHWMLINIPPVIRNIPKGASTYFLQKNHCIVCLNSFENYNYTGPQPPPNTKVHNYVFTIYAVDTVFKNINNRKLISEKSLLNKIKKHIIGYSEFTITRE